MPRTPSRLARLATLLVLLLAPPAACARSTPADTAPAPAGEDETPVPAGPAVLEVRNGSNYDVTVFVVQGGRRERVGLVTSGANASFEIAGHHMGREVRFFADPVGYSRTQLTNGMLLRPGIHVVFGLERLMRSHTLSVY